MRPSIYDIARSLDLSPTTVSRVINGSAAISPETSSRVALALQAAGFAVRSKLQRQGPRRRLQTQGAPLICVIGNADHESLQADIYQAVLDGIHDACARWDFQLVYRTLTDRRRGLPVTGVHGYIMLGGKFERLPKKTPVVRALGAAARVQLGDLVTYDDAQVGRLAFAQLASNQPSCLILVNRSEHRATTKRCAAFRAQAALHDHDLVTLDVPLLTRVRGRYRTDPAALEPLRPLIRSRRGQRLGLFVTEDIHLQAVIELCEQEGVCSSEQLHVVTVNNTPITRQYGSDLVRTIDIKARELGQRAVELVRWRLTHRRMPVVEHVMEPVLVPLP